ncbi:hypothetical protein KR215_004789 [Drosophila sulfurigaster]|uniref:uncharacterized protein LOC133836328 n=1 Tax=Drosophila sulfurigaster albostrigata TaxID=89887 RepID=UPI002D21C68C|nr:uncharacterized protein LOC133836328 [Drosophila sulfurigaster albostrigata]KAH8403868.1 hypothetical protein KR215_004789 [Drosophila sulfurigaster]
MDFAWMPAKKRARKPRKIEREWMPSDVKMLIQLVEQRELLWDSSKATHKDGKMREKSFRVIAEAMNRSLSDCKAKWDNLRAQYRGYKLKAIQNMSIKWQYFEALRFLDKVCEPQKYKNSSIICNDPSMLKVAFGQSHDQYMEELNTCSSFFSAARRRERKEEDLQSVQFSDDTMMAKARAAQEQNSTSAQIFGDFVADQMRSLRPHIADDLKKNILKLVLEALEQNKH